MSAASYAVSFFLVVGGYLVGSIPFAIVVGKWLWGVDVRDQGSGLIGLVNVFSVVGVWPGIIVLLCDVGKGFLPAFVAAQFLSPWVAVLVGLATLVGHLHSFFLRGSGGRGLATGAGILLALSWQVFLVVVGVFVVILLVSRLMSLAAIAATLAAVVATVAFDRATAYQLLAGVVLLIVVWRQRGNIRRIALRAEPKVAFPWEHRPGGDPAPRGSSS